MTLRIFVEGQPHRAIVSLHGWLSVAEVGELEKATASQGRPVTIDLTQLVGADTDGLRALSRLQGGGARLVGASPFIDLMLERTAKTDGRPIK